MGRYIDNKEMNFLSKLVRELAKLEKEVKFFELNADDIPASDDRHPYNEETEVSDYQFYFSYKENDFVVPLDKKSGLELNILDGNDLDFTILTLHFTMDESGAMLKEMWKNTLKKLEDQLNLQEPKKFFFHKWCMDQRITDWEPKNDATCMRMYALLTDEISPEEIERLLEEKYKEHEYQFDREIKNKAAYSLGVRFIPFLVGLRYFVTTKDEVFCFNSIGDAYKTFKNKTIFTLGESLKESLDNYNRI